MSQVNSNTNKNNHSVTTDKVQEVWNNNNKEMKFKI